MRELQTADGAMGRLGVSRAELTDLRAELATEWSYEYERCGAKGEDGDLHGINTSGPFLLIVCNCCGQAEVCDIPDDVLQAER